MTDSRLEPGVNTLAKASVTKSSDDVIAYRVTNDGERATLFVEPYQNPETGKSAVTITVNSSFGSFAHCWSSIGPNDWRDFLARLDRGYLLSKFFGAEAHVFCAESTVRNLMDWCEKEAQEQLNTEDFSDFKDECDSLSDTGIPFDSAESFYFYMRAVSERLSDQNALDSDLIGSFAAKKINPQANGFWTEIWPAFIDALQKEQRAEIEREDSHDGSARAAAHRNAA